MGISNYVEKREHEITEHFMEPQQILPAFVSHLGSKNSIEPGPPHEALFFVLAYLDVFELLVMSEVCMPLRDAVSKDVLPWRNIIIERPLNSRLSDEILVQITTRAHGRLRTLALINCFKITDDGLQTVIEKNHLISKLHIPGCSGLTPEGIIRIVKTLSQHHNSLESLQINGISSLKKEHLETISSHLQMNPPQQKPQPILYRHHRNSFTSRNKESRRVIDVDICPKCNEVRIVFDCARATSESGREQPFTHCRGCYFCISRCEECGRCVDDEEVEETLCSGILCTDCWLRLPKCCSCNKAYCKQHANQQRSSPDTTGFLCELCNEKLEFTGN
ncbi:F-BOX PROTEIN SKIP28 [Salix purpurea]|uniref:F-BOX PROTEIN SKIP28 n=1 Tax=Salix purpurea TaxID=77065 RepID=A0A9Q0TW40_SALPP|nr:F-BOX PROTEIN SKIP28 [Salix purpurea]